MEPWWSRLPFPSLSFSSILLLLSSSLLSPFLLPTSSLFPLSSSSLPLCSPLSSSLLLLYSPLSSSLLPSTPFYSLFAPSCSSSSFPLYFFFSHFNFPLLFVSITLYSFHFLLFFFSQLPSFFCPIPSPPSFYSPFPPPF